MNLLEVNAASGKGLAWTGVLARGLVLAGLLAVPQAFPGYGTTLATQVLIMGLLAMSLDVLIGYTGLVSFGHATFFGVGAYTAALLTLRLGAGFWLALLGGVAAALLLALVLGALAIRSSGAYFLMLTLALGQMVFAVAWRWRSLTGGDDGLPGIPRPDLGLPVSLWDNAAFYYFVLVIAGAAALLLFRLINSPFGHALVGVRESESRMRALGHNVWLFKYLGYVVAGMFAGLAGVLFVFFNGFVSPGNLGWTLSGEVMLMVIIGGAGTLWGPVLGAALILVLENIISSYTERWPLFMGIIFIICVLYAREGLAGYLLRRRKRRLAVQRQEFVLGEGD